MIKLAVIFESSPFDRKGLFNAVHNRVKHLASSGNYRMDVYCIHSRDNFFTRRVRHTPETPRVDSIHLDGICYRMLWYRFSILDHLTLEKLHRRPLLFRRFIRKNVGLLKDYDAVISHAFAGGLFAYEAYMRFGIPYYASWHGSDVHTHPLRVPVILKDTAKIMENAKCNFFVSKALMNQSMAITVKACKDVLYNGVADEFVRFPDEKRVLLRGHYGVVAGEMVVAYVGNLNKVKNVGALPEIFSRVRKLYGSPLKFWVIGDGKLRGELEAAARHCSEQGSVEITFFGNRPSSEIPDIMNCIDVLVLPSLNEGLGMVSAEALRCGANVVGSDVGGIPEVIGPDFAVPLGEDFASQIASKILALLQARAVGAPVVQTLPSAISWERTSCREAAFIRQL